MTTIATPDLRQDDVPSGWFNWPAFSRSTDAVPTEACHAVALRYYLHGWQRIGNNQGGLTGEAVDRVQLALDLLRKSFELDDTP
ncbi:hypothetical protein OOT46_24945 [Aquabacterium sp. A7-Y]|uniref:hypothetical protein n=1 Tax=Aquabacterium sp. A7-Y TaxID=1349605 RepID=UPI00223E7C22|nr:hypothetical protein [Aquabacterium sp. A7-Y]MCW7541070.1 hypothetical protein [Aquabacterium sp. A7-Y]